MLASRPGRVRCQLVAMGAIPVGGGLWYQRLQGQWTSTVPSLPLHFSVPRFWGCMHLCACPTFLWQDPAVW